MQKFNLNVIVYKLINYFIPDITLLFKLLVEFAWLGNWLFFVLAFIESAPIVGIFIPGATLISVGGFLASQGYLDTWSLVIFATLGAIIGDFFSYSLGRWGGNFIKRKKIINLKLLHHGEKFFNKYGDKSILWGRFFGPIRAIIPFIAGLSKMERGSFILWNIVSGISWALLNVFAGYFSGSLIVTIIRKWTGKLSLVLIIILTITLFYVLIKKRGLSIKSSFHKNSLIFKEFLHKRKWFINWLWNVGGRIWRGQRKCIGKNSFKQ